jgi:hypothetical protein
MTRSLLSLYAHLDTPNSPSLLLGPPSASLLFLLRGVHPLSISLPLAKAAERGEPSALPTRTNLLSTWHVHVLFISLSHHPFHHIIHVEAPGLSTDLTPPTPKSKLSLTTPSRRHIHPPTNVNARTLAILHCCLVPCVADRWACEKGGVLVVARAL